MPRRYGWVALENKIWAPEDAPMSLVLCYQVYMLTVTLLTGYVNSEDAWVTQDLLPQLPRKCVIVIDNARFHKRLDIQKAIHQANHTLLFLPP